LYIILCIFEEFLLDFYEFFLLDEFWTNQNSTLRQLECRKSIG